MRFVRMETAAHRHRLRWISACTSARANHKLENVRIRTHTESTMAIMRGALSLKRMLPIRKIIVTNCCNPPRTFWPPSKKKPMADQAPYKALPYESASTEGIGKGKEDDGEAKKSAVPPPPPPPEKPLAGDCCGSGCVRCVWDVYYEELEAYNKLYKTDESEANFKPS